MKRKVLKVGNASLAVSLPSKWAKDHNLKSGDEVEVAEKDGGLCIATNGRIEQEEITIKVSEGEHFVRRVIISPYIQGYNTIRVLYENHETRKKIDEVMNHIMGFEIVHEERGVVILKNVAAGVETEFNVVYQRAFHIVSTIFEVILDAIAKKDLSLLSEIDPYENTLNKLHNFYRRSLNTQSGMEVKKITAAYRIIAELESIGDALYIIASYLLKQKKMPNIKEGVEKTANAFAQVSHMVRNPSMQGITHHRHSTKDVEEFLEKKAMSGEAHVYLRLGEICHRTREMAVEILYPFE